MGIMSCKIIQWRSMRSVILSVNNVSLTFHLFVTLMCSLIYPTFSIGMPISIPLHITGSDSYGKKNSKIGGTNWNERAYDFHELLNTTNTLNHLSVVEYVGNGLKTNK